MRGAWKSVGLGGGSTLGESVEVEAACEFAEQAVFLAFHLAAPARRLIVVAEQVENAVDDVARQLQLPGGAKAARLEDGGVKVQEQLPMERWPGCARAARGEVHRRPRPAGHRRGLIAVVKREDIRRAGVAKEGFVHAGHLRRGQEAEAEVEVVEAEQAAEERRSDTPEEPPVHGPRALAVRDAQRGLGPPAWVQAPHGLRRCSS